MPTISVIIAVYNMKYLLAETLAALVNSTVKPHEIIVVDDGSKSDERIAVDDSSYKLITLDSNRGAAFAYNRGLDIATGDTILFLHADILVTPKTIERLLAELYREDNIGAVSPLATRMNYYPGALPPLTYSDWNGCIEFADKLYDDNVGQNSKRVMVLENFCLLARHEAVKTAGGFYEKYLSHGLEDIDITLAMNREGYKQKLIHYIYVHHQAGNAKEDEERLQLEKQWDTTFYDKWGFYVGYAHGLRVELLSFIDSQRENLAVLEIGCGCGGNLLELSNLNPNAKLVGVEISPHSAKIAGNFADIINIDVETLNADEIKDRFDYIIMGDVIEHLQEPWVAIANLRQLLKTGGELISSIPNVSHISNLYNLLNGFWQYEKAGILDRTHLRFFTQQEIINMFILAGFEIKHMAMTNTSENEACNNLRAELLALKSVNIKEENLDAFQWITVARRVD